MFLKNLSQFFGIELLHRIKIIFILKVVDLGNYFCEAIMIEKFH